MEKRGKSIEKRLSVSIFKVSMIIAAGALIGLIALISISNRYSYALKNFGFAQGDIGKAMFEFADLRSSLRAAIGYDDADAKEKESKGIKAYGIVASGRVISGHEAEQLAASLIKLRKATNLRLCASLGLLDRQKLERLRDVGLQMIHNNLETSERHFGCVCTTHTYEDKRNVIRAAKKAGLSVCSGALFGIGESMEDRIELALNERSLGVTSVPVNILSPAQGTPLEHSALLGEDDMRRIVAVFRFALPDAFIRMAAGREYLEDKGRSCFLSGANAAISGDFLTTMGISIETDLNMLREIGYNV